MAQNKFIKKSRSSEITRFSRYILLKCECTFHLAFFLSCPERFNQFHPYSLITNNFTTVTSSHDVTGGIHGCINSHSSNAGRLGHLTVQPEKFRINFTNFSSNRYEMRNTYYYRTSIQHTSG